MFYWFLGTKVDLEFGHLLRFLKKEETLNNASQALGNFFDKRPDKLHKDFNE